MMPDFVATSPDFSDEVWPSSHAFAHHEERGARAVAIEQVEDPRRVFFVRSVIDRQPHRGTLGRKGREHAEQALGSGRENRVKHKGVQHEKQGGARGSVPAKPQRYPDQLRQEGAEQ